MALQKCGLNLDKSLKELHPHGSFEFPCAGYSSYHTDRPEDVIPWHWHEEIEIVYIEDGQMKVKIPSNAFLLEKGDCIVINSNVLHYAATITECSLRSLVFSQTLITGNEDLIFAQKYMQPLLTCNSFSHYFIQADHNKNVAKWFNRAFEALSQDCYGYEFIVRENLSKICLFLYAEFHQQTDAQNIPPRQDNLRIRKMLAYIHKHFANDISLSGIASAADISERESLRCFKKMIQLSPIQYLLKYRIMQGADMLLRKPADSISEIATLCGFDSPSNFAKIFKRFYNCTPQEYRKSISSLPSLPRNSTMTH